jgi:glutathione S-transferase
MLTDSETCAVVPDSTDILHYLERVRPEPALFPDDADQAARVSELEEFFDEHCGRHVSGFLYHHILDHPEVVAAAWTTGLPLYKRALVRAIVPAARRRIRVMRGIDATSAAAHRLQVIEALDRLAGWLGESGDGYLVAGAFSAADLAAACLLGPAVRPAGSPWDARTRRVPETPGYPSAELVGFLDEVASHPAAPWVHDMWARHRQSVPSRGY